MVNINIHVVKLDVNVGQRVKKPNEMCFVGRPMGVTIEFQISLQDLRRHWPQSSESNYL